MAMYCERMRRRLWPEWFVDVDDWCYTGEESESGRSSPGRLLDFGLFSRTDTLEESESGSGSNPASDGPQSRPHSPSRPPQTHTNTNLLRAQADSHTHAGSPDSDRTGRSLIDSDIDSDGESVPEKKQEVVTPDL